MRRLAPIALCLVVGCGQLYNEPLRYGTVRGQMTGADPAVAVVAVFGRPELNSRIAADGSFEIRDVPVGAQELFAVASATHAARALVEVAGGRVSELGPLVPALGSFHEVTLKAPSKQKLTQGTLAVKGTPYSSLRPDAKDVVRVGPLPEGCFVSVADVPGLGQAEVEGCAQAGQSLPLSLALPPPDGTEGREGCSQTACEDHYICGPDGNCWDCVSNDQCNGLTCVDHECVGDRGVCGECRESAECGPYGECVDQAGVKRCTHHCGSGYPSCGQGFRCDDGTCRPYEVHLTGCGAWSTLGSSCQVDGDCTARGILTGRCLGNVCTHECYEQQECAAGWSCQDIKPGLRACWR